MTSNQHAYYQEIITEVYEALRHEQIMTRADCEDMMADVTTTYDLEAEDAHAIGDDEIE